MKKSLKFFFLVFPWIKTFFSFLLFFLFVVFFEKRFTHGVATKNNNFRWSSFIHFLLSLPYHWIKYKVQKKKRMERKWLLWLRWDVLLFSTCALLALNSVCFYFFFFHFFVVFCEHVKVKSTNKPRKWEKYEIYCKRCSVLRFQDTNEQNEGDSNFVYQ